MHSRRFVDPRRIGRWGGPASEHQLRVSRCCVAVHPSCEPGVSSLKLWRRAGSQPAYFTFGGASGSQPRDPPVEAGVWQERYDTVCRPDGLDTSLDTSLVPRLGSWSVVLPLDAPKPGPQGPRASPWGTVLSPTCADSPRGNRQDCAAWNGLEWLALRTCAPSSRISPYCGHTLLPQLVGCSAAASTGRM
jgi:hypothetical protein